MKMNRHSMTALLTAMFVSSIPATLLIPMIPSLGTKYGVGAAQLGLIVGIYPLMSMISSPFWGKLSDRFGRKPILIATLAGGALAFTVFAYSTTFIGLLVGRALQGLAGTPRGIGFAVASDVSDPENRAAGIGKITSAMAVAFTFGPLIGGLFMGEDPDSWTGVLRGWLGIEPGGFSHVLPSMIGALLNVVGMIAIMVGFQETWNPKEQVEKKAEVSTDTHALSEAIFHVAVILAILFFLLSGFIQGSLQFAFTLWADISMGWTSQWIAWAGMSIGLGFAIGSGLVLPNLLKRFSQEKVVLIGTVLDATGLALFLYGIEDPLVALTGLLIAALGGALWATTILGLLSKGIDPKDQGLVLGIANGASLFGRVMGPVLAGFLAATFNPGAPFIAIFACVVLAIVRGCVLVRKSQVTQSVPST